MATKNRGLNLCPDCDEYVEDCVCDDAESESEREAREADDWIDEQLIQQGQQRVSAHNT